MKVSWLSIAYNLEINLHIPRWKDKIMKSIMFLFTPKNQNIDILNSSSPITQTPFPLFLYSLEVMCQWFGVYLPDIFLCVYICMHEPRKTVVFVFIFTNGVIFYVSFWYFFLLIQYYALTVFHVGTITFHFFCLICNISQNRHTVFYLAIFLLRDIKVLSFLLL